MNETFDAGRLIAAMAPLSLRAVARRLDIDPAVLCRPLTATQADRYATRLHLHPSEVWGADWSRPGRRRSTGDCNDATATATAATATDAGDPR